MHDPEILFDWTVSYSQSCNTKFDGNIFIFRSVWKYGYLHRRFRTLSFITDNIQLSEVFLQLSMKILKFFDFYLVLRTTSEYCNWPRFQFICECAEGESLLSVSILIFIFFAFSFHRSFYCAARTHFSSIEIQTEIFLRCEHELKTR